MSQVLTEAQPLLTGNPLVDNGLAVIAALCKCDTIEDLTLRKIKLMHRNGKELARTNMLLKANYLVFVNSITQQPSYSQTEKISKYAKLTTALLNNIGHEAKPQFCDLCNNSASVDLDQLYREAFGKRSAEAKIKHYIGRDIFPLVGSISNDAQGLPAASRPLNACAKCLFAVQYLPRASILVNGLLAVFQSTSIPFWYQWVKDLTVRVERGIALARRRHMDKVETLGKAEGNTEVARMLLEVVTNSRRKKYDPNTSMTMYQYSNMGDSARIRTQLIPNFALNFLHKAVTDGLRSDIDDLTHLEHPKTSYRNTFLNRIAEREDYYLLYPDMKNKREGASPELFALYQTYIRGYPAKSLQTAYNIADYLKTKTDIDPEKLAINIQIDIKKQNSVRKWILKMVDKGAITFDEYYDLFVRDPVDHRNPWMLVKYYLLAKAKVEASGFSALTDNGGACYNQAYKELVVKVGTMIYERYFAERGSTRIAKLLTRLASGTIHRPWLVRQLEHLADDNEGFDYSDTWKALNAEEDLYGLLYLWRLLWTGIYKAAA